MTIIYKEKGIGLHNAVIAAGYSIWEENNSWKSNNDIEVQKIIDQYNELDDLKKEKTQQIKLQGLTLIMQLYPAITNFDQLLLFRDVWMSIAPAARNPVANWTKLINIYTAGANGVTAVNSATTKAQIDAITVNWPVI